MNIHCLAPSWHLSCFDTKTFKLKEFLISLQEREEESERKKYEQRKWINEFNREGGIRIQLTPSFPCRHKYCLCSSAALSQAAGKRRRGQPIPSGQPHTSCVLSPTLEPHIPGYPILAECPSRPAAPFPPATPSHPNVPCLGNPITLTFPYLKHILFFCLCLFPARGLFTLTFACICDWLPIFLWQTAQFRSQYVICFGAACLPAKSFISEKRFSVLTAAISGILTGISKLPTAHTNLFASTFTAGLTTQLQTPKIMPCPARNNPTMLWRLKFYKHCGSGCWQITQQSPVNLG